MDLILLFVGGMTRCSWKSSHNVTTDAVLNKLSKDNTNVICSYPSNNFRNVINVH